jgi:hypothetical protein
VKFSKTVGEAPSQLVVGTSEKYVLNSQASFAFTYTMLFFEVLSMYSS